MKKYKIGYKDPFTGKQACVIVSEKEMREFKKLEEKAGYNQSIPIPKKGITAMKPFVYKLANSNDYRVTGNISLDYRYFGYEKHEPAIFGEKWEVEFVDPPDGVIPICKKIKKIKNKYSLEKKLKWWMSELSRIVKRTEITGLADPRTTEYAEIIENLKKLLTKTI